MILLENNEIATVVSESVSWLSVKWWRKERERETKTTVHDDDEVITHKFWDHKGQAAIKVKEGEKDAFLFRGKRYCSF